MSLAEILPYLFLLLAAARQGMAAPAADFRPCYVQFAAHPESEAGPLCFYDTAKNIGRNADAAKPLNDLSSRYPELPWLYFYQGSVWWSAPAKAETFFRQAATRFSGRRQAEGEVRARWNLYELLKQAHEEEALLELRRAERVAQASGDTTLRAETQLMQAKSLILSLSDVAQSKRLLDESRSLIFRSGDDRSKGEWLLQASTLGLQLGRLDEALDYAHQLARLAARISNPYLKADAQYNVLLVLGEKAAELPRNVSRQEIRQEAESSVAANEGINRSAAALSHRILGMVTQGQESLAQFDACAASTQSAGERAYCLSGLALHLAAAEPLRAEKEMERARDLLAKSGSSSHSIFIWRDRMRVSWFTRPSDLWTDGQAALSAIEALRQAQGPDTRASRFSRWSDDYYWLAGRLLTTERRKPEDIDRAFSVMEHLRARTLVETLAGAGAEPASREQLAERLRSIAVAVQDIRRRAVDHTLALSERKHAEEDLAELKKKNAYIKRQLHLLPSTPRVEQFTQPDEVAASLGLNEALLSFEIAPWDDWTGDFGGGSWLTVVRHGAAPHVYRLSGREELRDLVSGWMNHFEAQLPDAREEEGSVALFDKLLAQPLHDLPPSVRRLIVVPDDSLNVLPWGALRTRVGGPPLAALYEISIAPSATLWRRWRRERPPPAKLPALVLAAPLAGPPLPRALAEGQTIVHILPESKLLRGADASKAFVEHTDLTQYGIFHLAAHSVIDMDNPELSAVRLSPSGKQDGDLRFANILRLRLDGRTVVLSSCEGARGEFLPGEGVMSLARAFFLARAHAVVASLWPIDDADAEALFTPFYRHLARGKSVAAALHSAQRERMVAGAPVSAWAGFEVFGDGSLVPVHPTRHPTPLG